MGRNHWCGSRTNRIAVTKKLLEMTNHSIYTIPLVPFYNQWDPNIIDISGALFTFTLGDK